MSDERATPKQARSITTRGRIVEAANTVYERVGRDYLKTQAVQQESGLSIGTIYRYFKDRVSLLDAVVEYRVAQGLEEAPAPAQAAPEVDDRAEEALKAIKKWCSRVIVEGEGKYDLKVAGQFILKEIEQRGF